MKRKKFYRYSLKLDDASEWIEIKEEDIIPVLSEDFPNPDFVLDVLKDKGMIHSSKNSFCYTSKIY